MAKPPLAVRRTQRREAHYRGRIAAARTAEEQFAAAVDWLRSAVSGMPGERSRLLREAAQVLADMAVAVERRRNGYSE